MDTIRADESDQSGCHEPEYQSGVHKSQRHGQYSRAQTSFQQMYKRFHVPEKFKRRYESVNKSISFVSNRLSEQQQQQYDY